ncbi:MAG: hypothetical protein D6689_02520 [Deltaproteobacteria bacterium]|nr:MAG: hypothetical protein D6689_02520 [Deltaproteobacteria bacterium]
MTARRAAWLAVALCACQGATGTIDIDLVAAPGVDPLAGVDRVRLTLTDPVTVVESARGPDGGFALSLEVDARGQAARVAFEGLDAAGDVVVWGQTPVLPMSAIDARVTVYVAPPHGWSEAPVALAPARTDIGAAALPFGALWAGGRDADGAPVDSLAIYNAYFHDLQVGDPLPEPRAAIAAAAGLRQFVYLFGGEGPDGEPTATFWRFATDVPPAGRYVELDSDPALARTGDRIALAGSETFLVAGVPPVLLDGGRGRATAVDGAPPLDGVPALLAVSDAGDAEVLVVGAGVGTAGAAVLSGGAFRDLPDAPEGLRRTGHAVVALPNGDALVVGGRGPDGAPVAALARYRRGDRAFDAVAGALATPRADAAVARAGGLVVVAGGTDGAGGVLGDAEVVDADTLEPLASVPLVVPRTGATAVALGNDQVVVAGGVGADGRPVEVVELYTPPVP